MNIGTPPPKKICYKVSIIFCLLALKKTQNLMYVVVAKQALCLLDVIMREFNSLGKKFGNTYQESKESVILFGGTV